jgi:archaetidylinositol phosphate synthase
MERTGFRDAERAQQSLLAAAEKKTLIWLAQHMPAWVNSDHLTALGALGMLLAGLSYWYAKYHRIGLLLVILCLVINWFGDSLDGTLARVRGKLRPRYGFYVDHVVDTFGSFFLLGGLALSGYMSPAIAAGLLIAYCMMAIEIFLATYCLGKFNLSFGKWGPTELRILLCVGNLFVFFRGPMAKISGTPYLLFDVGGIIGIIGMFFVLIVSSIRHTIDLYRQEPL